MTFPARSTQARLSLATTLAAPYSGTTLFAILLARHSQVSSDGEIFPFGPYSNVVCTCGKTQIECPYYREVAAHMLEADGKSWNPALFTPQPVYSRVAPVDKAMGSLWSSAAMRFVQGVLRGTVPAWRQLDQDFVAAHVRFMENSLRVRQAQVYLDCSKSVRRALLLSTSERVGMKIIHMVRDGRGFCYSYLKNKKLPRTHLPVAARAWRKHLRTIDRFRERLPNVPVLTVRYEDLCRDMSATLGRVCQFLEVGYEPALESQETHSYHILGNRMRLNFSGQVAECLRWQNEFTASEIDFLNRDLRAGLERYRYAGFDSDFGARPSAERRQESASGESMAPCERY